ncbi:hypothetical protein [Candidatus Palauibacter sp.]|uniref:hypothetical protein n=1 Tax=Candidatus Palauibacter sp. TaxID=3101350 RepID=UPI003CC60DAE
MERVKHVVSFLVGLAIIGAGLWAGVRDLLAPWAVVALVVLGLGVAFPYRFRALFKLVKDKIPAPRIGR